MSPDARPSLPSPLPRAQQLLILSLLSLLLPLHFSLPYLPSSPSLSFSLPSCGCFLAVSLPHPSLLTPCSQPWGLLSPPPRCPERRMAGEAGNPLDGAAPALRCRLQAPVHSPCRPPHRRQGLILWEVGSEGASGVLFPGDPAPQGVTQRGPSSGARPVLTTARLPSYTRPPPRPLPQARPWAGPAWCRCPTRGCSGSRGCWLCRGCPRAWPSGGRPSTTPRPSWPSWSTATGSASSSRGE